MPHEPGRERHMTYRCEHCGTVQREPLLWTGDDIDELWCQSCVDNAAEAAWERHNEWLMETGGGPTLAEQQAAARKLK